MVLSGLATFIETSRKVERRHGCTRWIIGLLTCQDNDKGDCRFLFSPRGVGVPARQILTNHSDCLVVNPRSMADGGTGKALVSWD